MIQKLIYDGVLKSPEIIKAFQKINRADFVLPGFREYTYYDIPLSIGYNQTISQPSTVAIMFELLAPAKGQKVLDIGSGSGWTTMLLSEIVGERGQVFGTEIIPELVIFGQQNVQKYQKLNIEIIKAENGLGLPGEAPFDRILVSAAAQEFPQELMNQLKIGGRMVIPIQYSLWQIDRISKDNFNKKEYPGFVFVPLVY